MLLLLQMDHSESIFWVELALPLIVLGVYLNAMNNSCSMMILGVE